MKEKKYFYFASPHSFKYPLYFKFLFKRKNDFFIRRHDNSKWIEVNNYMYYGEAVKCIIPRHILEYDFVFSLLYSEINDNIFGAINYMLFNYPEKFLSQVKLEKLQCVSTNILFQYFGKDI